MARALVLIVVAGCAGQVPAPEPAIAPPTRATRPHAVQPVELILRGRPEIGVQLARLAVHGEAWLRLGGDPQTSPGWHEVDGAELAVAEVRGDRVRILHDEDDVRMLVWIARGDLARVAVRDVELRPGVVVHAGTPVYGERIEADGLMVNGEVDADAIGEVWDAVAPRVFGETHTLAKGTPIRAERGSKAEILAVTTQDIEIRLHGAAQRGWREIETTGRQITVRGFVEEWALDGFGSLGHGSGTGYGSSHSITIDVPAGTCLYDAVGGEMIGVVTVTRSRLAYRTDDDAWYLLLVNSPWGLLDIPIHDGGSGWDRCADL